MLIVFFPGNWAVRSEDNTELSFGGSICIHLPGWWFLKYPSGCGAVGLVANMSAGLCPLSHCIWSSSMSQQLSSTSSGRRTNGLNTQVEILLDGMVRVVWMWSRFKATDNGINDQPIKSRPDFLLSVAPYLKMLFSEHQQRVRSPYCIVIVSVFNPCICYISLSLDFLWSFLVHDLIDWPFCPQVMV